MATKKYPFSELLTSDVRTVMIDNKEYFVAKDFCNLIGFKDHKKSTNGFSRHESFYAEVQTNGGKQSMIVISPKACLKLLIKKTLRKSSGPETPAIKLGNKLISSLLK